MLSNALYLLNHYKKNFTFSRPFQSLNISPNIILYKTVNNMNCTPIKLTLLSQTKCIRIIFRNLYKTYLIKQTEL